MADSRRVRHGRCTCRCNTNDDAVAAQCLEPLQQVAEFLVSLLSVAVFDRVWNSATMNQLYHPRRTASFFAVMAQQSRIPVFTITNNVVHDLATFADQEKKQKTLKGVEDFLKSNGYDFCCCDTHRLFFPFETKI